MNDNEPEAALAIAQAALALAFQTTDALLANGLLSDAKRRECARALQQLCDTIEAATPNKDAARVSLEGVTRLIDRLQGHL